jgi:hypothetical protein
MADHLFNTLERKPIMAIATALCKPENVIAVGLTAEWQTSGKESSPGWACPQPVNLAMPYPEWLHLA